LLGPNMAMALGTALGDLPLLRRAILTALAGIGTAVALSVVIGVMVAVALLPPLVAFGLLMGNGQPALATGALSLFLMNLICVNLAGVGTFLVQGIRPAT
jgi:uncharacterized membrane protein